jgi:hypothetical protein
MKNIHNKRNARMNSRLMEKWGFNLKEGHDDGESEDDEGEDEKDPEAKDYTDEGDREGDESKTHPGDMDDTTKRGTKIKTGPTKGEKAYEDPSGGEKCATHKGTDFTWSTKHAKNAVSEALKNEGMNEEQFEALMQTIKEGSSESEVKDHHPPVDPPEQKISQENLQEMIKNQLKQVKTRRTELKEGDENENQKK